jgi:hypothetical protein
LACDDRPAVETPVVARFVGSGLRSADLESPFAPALSAPVFLEPAWWRGALLWREAFEVSP